MQIERNSIVPVFDVEYKLYAREMDSIVCKVQGNKILLFSPNQSTSRDSDAFGLIEICG